MKALVNLESFGTKLWRSYALFRVGIDCAAAKDHEAAEELFVEALREDANHAGALVNYASALMVQRDGGPDVAFALIQLEKVLERLGNDKSRHTDAVYYTTLYRLAAAHYDLSEDRLSDATRYARKLVDEIDIAEGKARAKPDSPLNARLSEFIDQIKKPALVMLLGLQIEGRKATLSELRKTVDASTPTAQVQYNYACALAGYARVCPEEERSDIIAEAKRHLSIACRMKPALRARAEVDRSLEPLKTMIEEPANGS